MIKRIVKRILVNIYLLRKIDFFKLWRLTDRNSDEVFIFCPPYPQIIFKFFFSPALINDVALLRAMISRGRKFRFLFGSRKAFDLENKTIIHNVSSLFSFYEGKDYVDSLQNFQKKLAEKGNRLIPSIHDTMFWENKIYMHQKFKDLNISHPKTIIVDGDNPAKEKIDIEFPLLFKPAHSSGSTGIKKLNTHEEYLDTIKHTKYSEYMIQEWIDMRRDIRLIYIGDELVLHYWRINEGSEWKPTSTGHGSSVDFETLPDRWMDFIFKEYKKLGLKTGAFDITWRKDDLETKPLILEVSPSYMPNPAPVGKFLKRPYGQYKKAIWGKEAYYKQYINLVCDQKIKLLEAYDN